ncbi:recombinase family protein [Methylomonas koyamae]|uniref:recombinase family protein n=1 Tax=Methylomonas koyamae TaxID=702114 RepID=UPI002873011C|nr:recombinase family protein [Methylomonas koyamae]WNB75700.1 recombinase family protein [Methylomonas koyamae]
MNEHIITPASEQVKPKAYSYIRFSTPEQAQGDSQRRQKDDAEKYALQHGLDLDDKLTFKDLGVSAYRGKNAETGRLGEFLEAVREGMIERNAILLVESLDRISRQAARKALRILEDIVDEGITVITINDGAVYTAKKLNEEPMSLLMAILIFIRANEESANKAGRLAAAWAAKRDAAQSKPLTALVPAWLKLDKKTGAFEVIEERAEIVRRIYRETIEGAGYGLIAKRFNDEGITPFGKPKKGSKGDTHYWHRTYVQKILRNPAVTGEYTPHRMEHADGKKVRKPAGERIANYFPAVVDAELYQAVQAMRQARSSKIQTGRGSLQNLLTGLIVCPICGSTMTRKSPGATKKGESVFVCAKAKAGAGCKFHGVKQHTVEGFIVENIDRLLAEMPSGNDTLDAQVENLSAGLHACGDHIDNLTKALMDGYSPTIAAALRKAEQDHEETKAQLDDALARQAAASDAWTSKRIESLTGALSEEPIDKTRANVALRQLLNSIVIDYRDGCLYFNWKNGGTSSAAFAWPEE